jgi:ribonuclease-3
MSLERASEILGHQFTQPALVEEAFRHASAADNRLASNERMEFLGDAILGCTICAYLYKRYPHLLEGDLTKIKSAVVSRRVCAEISERLGLSQLLDLGKGMSNHVALPTSVSAAALESAIAAIYLDGGLEPAERFILKYFVPYIEDAEASSHQENYKSVLQQYAQRHLPANPSYVILDEKGPDHSKAFEIAVVINGEQYESAWANSKKEAEQRAALHALRALGLIHSGDEAGNALDPTEDTIREV